MLRPATVRYLREAYLSTFEGRFLATVAIIAVLALGFAGLHRVQSRVRRRYGRNVAEASVVAGAAGLVIGTVYAFAVVWRVTYVLEYTLATMDLGRWTVALLLVTGAIVATAYFLIRFVNRSIDKLAETGAITTHQREVAYHVADVGIILVGSTLVLSLWGIDLTNVFIGAGAITAIVALTARETLTAMVAGFILLLSRPFRVGDWIEVDDGRSEIVTDVTIFTTKIQTFADEYVLVPNDEITSSHLTNYSRNERLRVDVEVGIDYDTDVSRARSVIVDAVGDLESIRSTPDPEVVAKRFGDSAIVLELRVWIDDPTVRRKWEAQTDAIEAIAAAFDREGITIPYPQRVHTARNDDGLQVSGPIPDDATVSSADD